MEVYIKGLLPSRRALHSDSAHSKTKKERVRRKELEKRRRLKKDIICPILLSRAREYTTSQEVSWTGLRHIEIYNKSNCACVSGPDYKAPETRTLKLERKEKEKK